MTDSETSFTTSVTPASAALSANDIDVIPALSSGTDIDLDDVSSASMEDPERMSAAEQAKHPTGEELTERDQQILSFERQWWKYPGAKEQMIRERFDMSSTRYYQVLNALIDSSVALEHDPMLVKRLRRLRASRQKQRSARRLGIEI